MARSEDMKTPLARVSFAQDLFEPRTKKNGSKDWGCTLLFPKSTDITALKKLAADAAIAEWGDKAIQWIKDELIKTPFLDGDGKQALSKKTGERHEGYAGCTFIRCSSGEKYKPLVVDQRRQPILDTKGLKSGDYVYAVVNAFTWVNDENGKGVSFGISLVQKVRDGESIGGAGGGADPEKFFETIADEGDAPEATKSGAGASALFA